MPIITCPTCLCSDGDVQLRGSTNSTFEVSLIAIYNAASNCSICSFVQELLKQDPTTPDIYSEGKVRIEDYGSRFTGQWHGALVIEIYKPGSLAPKLPTPNDVPGEISCEAAGRIVNRWTKDCEEHTECNAHDYFANKLENGKPSSHFMPKRLIHLGDDHQKARLVSTSGKSYEYAALSYCWGGNGTFKTEDKTLSEHEQEIQLDKLPQTIRDAFDLTKQIGLEYLWIDAICIVQGNAQEWELESSNMGHIYSNARIVISATRSANVKEGIFTPRSISAIPLSQDTQAKSSSLRARRNLNHEIITSCRTKSNKWWEQHINTSFPLLSRGWGFQERMLATRIVHFTPSEMVWECQRCRRCECEVVESDLYPAKNNLGSALRVCLEKIDDERARRQMWREVVNSYSVRKLTMMGDRLVALEGIACLLRERSGDEYLAGLWRASLPFDLLWRCDQSVELQKQKSRCPSWSWASVDGAVKWPVCQNEDEEQPLQFIRSTTYFEAEADGVEVVSVEYEQESSDEHGRARASKITLNTRIAPATIQKLENKVWIERYGTKWTVKVGDGDRAPFWPDINEESMQMREDISEELLVIEIMKSKGASGSWEEALVVRLCTGYQNEYERLGVTANVSAILDPWTTNETWFASSEYSHRTLI